jgi:hypothetical protein
MTSRVPNQPEADAERLVLRLRKAAESASKIHREMAEAKSLRQEGNTERRTDLYSWPTPEQTLEGQAAAYIERLASKPADDGEAK